MKVYYLSTCSTCHRIMSELPLAQFEKQDIKSQPLLASHVDDMHKLAGSYQALFSRKAMKYRSMNLHNQLLTEADYRRLILAEYTFLKRPVFIVRDKIFIGNSGKTVEALKKVLEDLERRP